MIGIIAAMNAEVEALCELMQHTKSVTKDGICFWEGQLSKQQVVLMLSGVGKGNAAMATTILLKNYAIDMILNIGTAGGLKQEENVLDLVISETIVQHDFDTSAVDGKDGIGLYYQADPVLVKLCQRVCEQLQEHYHVGLIASGDQFIAKNAALDALLAKFPNAMCAEMEAGAIAQVCDHFQKRFIILRSLSDIAHKEKSHLDFCEYVHMASKRSAHLCQKIVDAIAES